MVKDSLSSKELKLVSRLELDNRKFVRIKDIMKILSCDRKSAYNIVYKLTKKKRLIPIKKSTYLVIPVKAVGSKWSEHEFIIAKQFVKNYYIGYLSALNYYGFSEQIPRTIFIANMNRSGTLKIKNLKFRFIKIKKEKFFGYDDIKIEDEKINLSDKEKTLLDCLDKQKLSGGFFETVKAFDTAKNEIDSGKLVKYAFMMKNNSLLKRLGYILDYVKKDSSKNLKKISEHLKNDKKFVYLSLAHEKKGRSIEKWKVIENFDKNELVRELEVY